MSQTDDITIKLHTVHGLVVYKFTLVNTEEYPQLKNKSYSIFRENVPYNKRLLLMEHASDTTSAIVDGILMFDVVALTNNDTHKLFFKIAEGLENHLESDYQSTESDVCVEPYDATGFTNHYLNINIHDIAQVENIGRVINISVEQKNNGYGPATKVCINSMAAVLDVTDYTYRFSIKKINNVELPATLDIPTDYVVNRTTSLMVALNSVVTVLNNLLREKYPTIFKLLGY